MNRLFAETFEYCTPAVGLKEGTFFGKVFLLVKWHWCVIEPAFSSCFLAAILKGARGENTVLLDFSLQRLVSFGGAVPLSWLASRPDDFIPIISISGLSSCCDLRPVEAPRITLVGGEADSPVETVMVSHFLLGAGRGWFVTEKISALDGNRFNVQVGM